MSSPTVAQETGANYYANVITNETCWELPKELSGDVGAPAYVKLQNGWFQYTDDETGRHYYYNNRTEQTLWSLPADAGSPDDGGYVSDEDDGANGFAPPDFHDTDDDDDEALPSTPSQFKAKEEDAATKAKEKEEKRYARAPAPSTLTSLQLCVCECVRACVRACVPTNECSSRRRAAARHPRPSRPAALHDRAARRLKILEEVVSSERVYVQALEVLERVYVIPLRTVCSSDPFPRPKRSSSEVHATHPNHRHHPNHAPPKQDDHHAIPLRPVLQVADQPKGAIFSHTGTPLIC